ncbi:MAG TPA: sigma-70 family RNA polymerase sigma factor [Acetobacteraceae bacterium]
MSMEATRRRAHRAIRNQIDQASLTAERERQLLRTVRANGDELTCQTALTELWESHSKLVIAIANRYRHTGIDLLDLVGAGHLGLHAAIARFEPERFESRLSTYAIGWIRWYVQDYIRRNSGPVRLPGSTAHRQLVQMSGRLFADARKSCQRERVEATESELCARIGRRIGLPGDEVARSMHLIQGGTISLHGSAPDDTSAPRLEDTLADDSASPEEAVILRLDHAKARKRIMALTRDILGERERVVFLARCMTGGDEIAHLDSLAKDFGVSRERVYQLEASAKRKIATALAQEGFGDFLRDGQTFRAPAVRARRRRVPAMPLRKEEPRVQSVAQS